MFIFPIGHFNEVVTIEEGCMDLVKDYCRSVCVSCLDSIVYLLYGTVPNTKQSVQFPFKCVSIHS